MDREEALKEISQIWQDAGNYPTSALIQVREVVNRIFDDKGA